MRLTSCEIAVALAVSIAAGAFLFATSVDGSDRSTKPVAAYSGQKTGTPR